MPLGKLFRRFSLQALGRRWFNRFGRSLKNRFLRQDVHRKWMRVEPLEGRELLSTFHSVASGNWNSPATWQLDSGSGTFPVAGDTANIVGGATVTVTGNEAVDTVNVNTGANETDRKSTRLNSSHLGISYAVFC